MREPEAPWKHVRNTRQPPGRGLVPHTPCCSVVGNNTAQSFSVFLLFLFFLGKSCTCSFLKGVSCFFVVVGFCDGKARRQEHAVACYQGTDVQYDAILSAACVQYKNISSSTKISSDMRYGATREGRWSPNATDDFKTWELPYEKKGADYSHRIGLFETGL